MDDIIRVIASILGDDILTALHADVVHVVLSSLFSRGLPVHKSKERRNGARPESIGKDQLLPQRVAFVASSNKLLNRDVRSGHENPWNQIFLVFTFERDLAEKELV
jgi:hypothetical protein